jgi:hypothetical protein
MGFLIQIATMTIIIVAIKINESESIYLNKDYAQRKAKELISKYDLSFNAQLSAEELVELLITEDSCFSRVVRTSQEKKKTKYFIIN